MWVTASRPAIFSCICVFTSARSPFRSIPECSSSRASWGSPLSATDLGRCVSPMTRENVVGEGYESRFFVTAHPEIPLAPKTRATFFLSAMVIGLVQREALLSTRYLNHYALFTAFLSPLYDPLAFRTSRSRVTLYLSQRTKSSFPSAPLTSHARVWGDHPISAPLALL
ncbi:hypothetical protein VTO42DRAFT_1403 [Malbranchea cinnamomea]